MTTVYKVVQEVDGELRSVFARGILLTRYTPGETTYPELGKSALFAFTKQEQARAFARTSYRPSLQIWRAKGADVVAAPRYVGGGFSGATDEESSGFKRVLKWWRVFRGLDTVTGDPFGPILSPKGAVFCSSIQLDALVWQQAT